MIDEKILASTEMFKGLSDEHRRKLWESGKERKISRGEHLFHEGEKGGSFFLLLEGSVKLYKLSEEGREVIVRLLKGGEIFGEVVLFVSEKYPVSSLILSDSKVLRFEKDKFLSLLDDGSFRNEFIGEIMKKQRYLSGRIHYLTAFDVEERFFLFLKENYGEKETYEILLSKKDLASAIGTIPETFSRLTARLKKRGILRWEKKILNLKPQFWEDFE